MASLNGGASQFSVATPDLFANGFDLTASRDPLAAKTTRRCRRTVFAIYIKAGGTRAGARTQNLIMLVHRTSARGGGGGTDLLVLANLLTDMRHHAEPHSTIK